MNDSVPRSYMFFITGSWGLCSTVLIVLSACGGEAALMDAVVMRDSAGVEIVETNTPLWDLDERWSVDSIPKLTIGVEDGEEPYMLSLVAGAIRLENGSVVVADGASSELRLFDSEGVHLRSFGRRGQGPAEFRRIAVIGRCGVDEIWIDAGNRISIWGLDLEYRREFVTPQSSMRPLVCFGAQGVLVRTGIGDLDEAPLNTVFTDTLILQTRDSAGESLRELFRIPLWDRLAVHDGQGRSSFVPPMSRKTVISADGNEMAIGFARTMEIDRYAFDGSLVRRIRAPVEDLVVNQKINQQYQSAELTGQEENRRTLMKLAGNPMPATVPAYTELIVDREGNTWVKRWVVPGSPDIRWGVFSAVGVFLGHLELPSGLTVHEIGDDYVLGQTMDSLYVQRVVQYRLNKPR